MGSVITKFITTTKIIMKVIVLFNFLWFASVLTSSPEENLNTRDAELLEGDMKFLPGQARGSAPGRLWPNGNFVYQIESDLSSEPQAMSGITSAMRDWTTLTKGCIKFKKRTSEQAYVSFFKGSGCWSYVGRTGRKQQLSLAGGCWRKGTVIHEIGHALGFLHEQSRPDRNNYVEIKFENIQSGKENNFRISNSIDSLGTPYDYGSIMHYGARYFSKNGRPTIVPKKQGVTIGNRRGLSAIDIRQMMLLYKCGAQPPPSTRPPPTTIPPAASFSCNFESNCRFKQNINDKFDWTVRSGSTPSRYTGPSGDHTTGQGKYSFIETSSPRRKGDNAIMSRMVILSGKSCLRFYYHMYGADMGTLRVKLCNTVLFEKSGNQGNTWKMHQVRLSGRGSFELSFEGIRGNNYRGDAAIDDITVYDC